MSVKRGQDANILFMLRIVNVALSLTQLLWIYQILKRKMLEKT